MFKNHKCNLIRKLNFALAAIAYNIISLILKIILKAPGNKLRVN